jgi:hypothetical protein
MTITTNLIETPNCDTFFELLTCDQLRDHIDRLNREIADVQAEETDERLVRNLTSYLRDKKAKLVSQLNKLTIKNL